MDLPELIQWCGYFQYKNARLDRDLEMAKLKAGR